MNIISDKMRSTAFFKTSQSHRRRAFIKRSKRRRFPLKRKYKKKSSKFSSNYRRRRFYIKNKIGKVDESKVKNNARDQSPNIDELIENMSLLQL